MLWITTSTLCPVVDQFTVEKKELEQDVRDVVRLINPILLRVLNS